MPRLRLIFAVLGVCILSSGNLFGCPAVAKRFISSDLIEPLPFAAIPGQRCDECPIPTLMVLDFDAGKLPPSDHGITDEQVDFLELYFAAGGFFGEAFNNDPRHECMRYFDNHFEPNSKTVREMLPSQPIPPPTGAVSGVDYVVSGKIAGARGQYSMTVSLEDASTREQIASSSVQFARAGDAMSAGEQAERAMAPLFDKIREYQKKLRDRSDDMAIHAKLKITPSQEKMNVGEKQSVEVFAYDCDGEDHPLKNRKIKLTSGNGTFSPEEVTTGSDGKVKATFTAQKRGLANVNATYFPYTTVTHHQAGAHDDAHIQIGDPPSGIWQADIEVMDNDFDQTVKATDDGEDHHSKNDHQAILRHAHVTLWVKQSNGDTGSTSGSEIIAASGNGSFQFTDTFLHIDISPGCTQRVSGSGNSEGEFKAEGSTFAFDILPDHANVNGTLVLRGKGGSDTWHFESCADPPNVHQHSDEDDVSYSIEFGYGSDQLDAPQTAETRRSRMFKFNLAKNESTPDPEKGGLVTRQRSGTITLRPLTMSQSRGLR